MQGRRYKLKKVLWFFMLLIVSIAFIAFGGCAGEDTDERGMNPQQVVEQYWAAVSNLDLERARSFVSNNYSTEFDAEFDELITALDEETEDTLIIRELWESIFHSMDLQVTEYIIDGDRATVKTVAIHPDSEKLQELFMIKFLDLLFSDDADLDEMSDREGMQLFIDLFKAAIEEVDYITTEADCPMVLEGGLWKIDGNLALDYGLNMDL